jgi:MYXO-CTERM domain-containing protein
MGACIAALTAGGEGDAVACGGFFCSQTQTVNQAAERIIFVDNGDDTVTAVIQILYEGPAENFSWLLPIPSVPEAGALKVASDVAFQRLQAATNPRYFLNVRVEGECAADPRDGSPTGVNGSAGEGGAGAESPVSVEARGQVGPFEWEAISVEPGTPNPADVAVAWLADHGYDVPEGTPGLLRPYLEDGLYLLALRLTKDADSGSIRPIVLTYESTRPSIPVRPTAVAANENMGVMTWIVADARAVPANYLSLELNEARLNWFNPNSNYSALVTAAADEAGGQGFVTEFAGPSSTFGDSVWSGYDEDTWQRFVENASSSYSFLDAFYNYGDWDGFWETVRTLTPPEGATWDEVEACPYCFDDDISLSDPTFLAAFEANVIEPVRSVQELINRRPALTRLYTTLSADEMTVDPLFTFNPDQPDVSNVHNAERVVECSPEYYFDEAPFRIELPQGGVVRGSGADAQSGTWPEEFDEQPANLRILQLSDAGEGRVLEDNGDEIESALDAYNAALPKPVGTGSGGEAGEGGAGSGGLDIGRAGRPTQGGSSNSGGRVQGEGGEPEPGKAGTANPSEPAAATPGADASGCACRVPGGDRGHGFGWVPLGLAALLLLRRRRTARSSA